ncbi:MAG: MerR family transcriptional regulator [Aristaeellaceae bacterium]
MMTIGEMSRIAHVSVRTLHHYDRIGLLHPCGTTSSGYRLYDDTALQRLHTILLFRELEFPLSDIRRILDTPGFDPMQALDTQITLLTMRREHLDNLILLARGLKLKGMNHMNFDAFDTRKLDDYAAQAKAAWGSTPAYQEFEQKQAQRTHADNTHIEQQLMELIAACGQYRHLDPACEDAQAMVQQLRDFITANFYTCTVPILRGLADMYDGGGDFTRNIDQAGGSGTASFLAQAMRVYCNIHQHDA